MSKRLLVLALSSVCLFASSHAETAPKRVEKDHHGNVKSADGEYLYTNALSMSDSPYLLQHAHNPVDWFEWGEAAFEMARAENRPIFLSIGYSTCHWCHVMARESFSDEEVAELLNNGFIPIKVDREARPDVDAVYMAAVHAMGQRGGWPLSVWLTPELEPFAGGTYFPKRRFITTLLDKQSQWLSNQDEVRQRASEIAARTRSRLESSRAVRELDETHFAQAVHRLQRGFDGRLGGWGVPKFPNESAILYLLDRWQRDRSPGALRMATKTLDAMQAGGIHDHIGGGFARYATDANWLVPHFEKMLYNQAWLSRAYLEAYRLTGDEDYRRSARGTFTYIMRDMTQSGGGFYSAEDADSDGEEGLFYVWRREEMVAALGAEDGQLVADYHGIKPPGNFRDIPGASIPTARQKAAPFASARGMSVEALYKKLDALHAKLTEVRGKRVRPERDEKIMADWNGYMIGAFAMAGRVLDDDTLTRAGAKAADFILEKLVDDRGRMLHGWYRGQASGPAFLDDYVAMIDGLLELYDTTGEARWLSESERLWKESREQFRDPKDGAFTRTGPRHEKLLARGKDSYDGARPAGNSLAAWDAVRLYRMTGKDAYRQDAEKVLLAFGPSLGSPRGAAFLLRAGEMLRFGASGPIEHGDDGVVSTRAGSEPLTVTAGGRVALSIALDIADGWHVNAAKLATDEFIATELAVSAPLSLDVRYPEAVIRRLGFSKRKLRLYEGQVEIPASIGVPSAIAFGPTVAHLDLRVQPCNDKRCLKPRTLRIEAPLIVVPSKDAPVPQ